MLHRIVQKTTGSDASRRGGGRAKWSWLEWGAGAVLLGLLIVLLLPVVNLTMAVLGYNHPGPRQFTKNTMKQWGLVFKMYAHESNGERWPNLVPVPKMWVPDLSQVYPEYLTDPSLLVSSGHPESEQLIETAWNVLAMGGQDYIAAAKLMSESFAYFGYLVMNESDVALLKGERDGRRLKNDGAVVEMAEGEMLLPMREGIERFLITDINGADASIRAQSPIPVLVEVAGWKHKKSLAVFEGANVLYMDGHVAFVPQGTFPVVPSVMNVLSGLAQ
ncbi:MAG: hypothetical protein L3K26_18030 [Candidatus Hydrogenedentes bacterium]|nr:hypothetical protein [Candidatus Hydrogenedentota bacterium]